MFTALGIAIGSIYLLFVYYLAVMNLQRVHKESPLTGVTLYAGYSVFLPGYLLDLLVNMVPMSILMLELPREWLVTARLTRHLNGPDGRRKRIAEWFCTKLLDRFDPSGCHCKRIGA